MTQAPAKKTVDRSHEPALLWLLLCYFDKLQADPFPRLHRHQFYGDNARVIFDAICQVHAERHPVHMRSVRAAIQGAGHADPDKVLSEVMRLGEDAPTSWREAQTHTATLLEDYARRQTTAALSDALASTDAPLPVLRARVTEAASRAQASLSAINAAEGIYDSAAMMDAIHQHWEDLDAGRLPPPISSGMRSLDKLLGGVELSDGTLVGGGFRQGQTVAIIGAEKSGKSALAYTLARRMALDQGLHVLIACTELTFKQVAQRLVVAESAVPHIALSVPHYMSSRQASAFLAAQSRLRQAPIHVWDQSFIDRDSLFAKVHAMHAQGKCDVLVIDHLMRMQPTPREEAAGTPRASVLRAVVAQAADWASRTGGLVLIPCQASALPKDEQRLPYAHETAECHTVAWEVDHALAIHRPHAYDPSADKTLAHVALRVSRVADTGQTRLYWQGDCTDFHEPPRDHEFYEPEPEPQRPRKRP
jgi:replicative DNA helicase